jgi:hypothetical protein
MTLPTAWGSLSRSIRPVLQILGLVAAASAIVQLVSKLAGVGLRGVVGEVVGKYSELRDFVLAPLIAVLDALSLNLEPWARDIVALYMVVAASMFYTGAMRFAEDRRQYADDPHRFEFTVRRGALLVGKDPVAVWRRVERGLRSPRDQVARNVWSSLRWPQMLGKNLSRAARGDVFEKRQTRVFASRVVLVMVGVLTFFCINYVQGL